MKKVIILSYYASPCSLTASLRIDSWFRHLNKFDIHPILVTRKWESKIQSLKDISSSTSKGTTYQKYEFGEAFHLEYKGNLKDKIYNKYGNSKYKLLRKSLSYIELFFSCFTIYAIPYKNLYFQTKNLLKKHNDIDTIIISGGPFYLFHFGYRLKRKYPYINWIADYRDDWNTSELFIKSNNFLQNILNYLEKKSEIKWLSNSKGFTTISPCYVDKIKKLIHKPGNVIFNGFDKSLLKLDPQLENDVFVITYNGSLYKTQNLEDFIDVIKKVIIKFQNKIKLKIKFIGVGIDIIQKERLSKLIEGYQDFFLLTERIKRDEVIQIQLASDLLVMLSHVNQKGIPSSKIFEYVGLRKRFIVFPNDHDIIEKIAHDSSLGIISVDKLSLFKEISTEINNKIRNPKISRHKKYIKSNVEQFCTTHQVKRLSKLL